MDGHPAEESLPFMTGSGANLPQLRSDLSASLLATLQDGGDIFQDDTASASAFLAAASGVHRNLDSVGKISPHRTRSIRDHESQISDLKKENFSLKLRIYFLEERVKTSLSSEDEDTGFQLNIDLQVEVAQLKSECSDKQVLLQRAANAIDALTHSNEDLATERKTVDGLRSELTTVREELERFKQESKFHHDQCQAANSELSSLQSIQGDHIALRRQYDNLARQATTEKATLADQLKSVQQKIEDGRQALSASEASNQKLKEAYSASSTLAEQVPALQAQLNDKTAAVEDLKERLSAAGGHAKDLRRERDGLQAADSKKSLELQLEIRTRDARISDLETEVAHQQELLKGVEANLKESHGTSVQRAVHHYEELMAQHARDLADTRRKLQVAQQEVTQKDVQISALESQLAERDGRIAMSATEVDSKAGALQLATTNAQKNADLVKELGTQLKERNSEMTRLRQELADMQDNLDMVSKDTELQTGQDAAKHDSQLRSLKREIEKLRASIEQERKAKLSIEENVDALKDALASKDQSLQNVRHQLEHASQLHRQRQARLEQQYQDQLESLRRDLGHRDAAASRLTEALQEKEAAIKDLSEIAGRLSSDGSPGHRDLYVQQLTNQIMELRRRMEQVTQDSDVRIDELEKEVQQLRRQNSKLQRELKEAHSDLQQSKKVSKRIEDANGSRENLLDVLNRSFAGNEGDETATNLLQAELTAREAEVMALASQIHDKEKEILVLQADRDHAQKSHADFVQQFQEALQQKDRTIEQMLKAGQGKDQQLLRLTEDSMSRSGKTAHTKSQLDDLRDANSKLESMARGRETQLQSYQVAAQAKDGVIKSLQEQLQMQRGRMSMSPSRRTAESVEADVLVMQAQLKASQELVDEQRRQLNAAHQEKERFQQQLDAITREAISLGRGPSPSLDPSLDAVESRRPEAEADVADVAQLYGKLLEAEVQVSSLRSQLTDSQRWNDALQSRLDTEKLAAGQVDQLTGKLRKTEADLARARSTVEELREELEERDAQLQDVVRLQAQLRSSHAERDLLQRRMDDMGKISGDPSSSSAAGLQAANREALHLQETNRQLREDLLRAGDDMRVATAETASLQSSLQRARDDLLAKQAAVQQLESEAQRARDDLLAKQAAVQQLESEAQGARGELLAAQSATSAGKAAASTAQDECNRLRHLAQVTEGRLREGEASLQATRAELAAARVQLSSSQERQKHAERDARQAEARAAAQLSTVAALRMEIEELGNRLDSERAAIDGLRSQLLRTQDELKDAQNANKAKRQGPDLLGSELEAWKLRSGLRSPDVSDTASQADSLQEFSSRYQAEAATLRQELEVTRRLVDQLSTERSRTEQRCRELAEELTRQTRQNASTSQQRSVGVGSDLADSGVHLNADILRQILSAQRADQHLCDELRRLLRLAGYSQVQIDRLLPRLQQQQQHQQQQQQQQQPQQSGMDTDDLSSLRSRYSEGVRANEQLQSRLQDQLSACDAEKRQWRERSDQQSKLLGTLSQQQQQQQQSPRGGSTTATPRSHALDLSAESGMTVEDLRGLCRDLSRSLRASQALQSDLGVSLATAGTPMVAFLQHEKDRLASNVASLNERLANLLQENRRLRGKMSAHSAAGPPSTQLLSELERELEESHAIATRLRGTLATRDTDPATNVTASSHQTRVDYDNLTSHLTALRHALQQHTQASESLRDRVSQSGSAASSSSPFPTSTSGAAGTGAATAAGLSGGFGHMERQVRAGLASMTKLEAAIASVADHVDDNTVHHLLQLARQLRAQLEAADILLSQLKHVAPTTVSSSVENQVLKVELAKLRQKLLGHEKVMHKALKHIQQSKSGKENGDELYTHLKHTDDLLQQAQQNVQTFTDRYHP